VTLRARRSVSLNRTNAVRPSRIGCHGPFLLRHAFWCRDALSGLMQPLSMMPWHAFRAFLDSPRSIILFPHLLAERGSAFCALKCDAGFRPNGAWPSLPEFVQLPKPGLRTERGLMQINGEHACARPIPKQKPRRILWRKPRLLWLGGGIGYFAAFAVTPSRATRAPVSPKLCGHRTGAAHQEQSRTEAISIRFQ